MLSFTRPPAFPCRDFAATFKDETGALPTSREARADLGLLGVGPGIYPENPSHGYGDKEFMIGESACAGDSGGPAIAITGAVIGVASRAGRTGRPL